jgi:hypothetical protein
MSWPETAMAAFHYSSNKGRYGRATGTTWGPWEEQTESYAFDSWVAIEPITGKVYNLSLTSGMYILVDTDWVGSLHFGMSTDPVYVVPHYSVLTTYTIDSKYAQEFDEEIKFVLRNQLTWYITGGIASFICLVATLIVGGVLWTTAPSNALVVAYLEPSAYEDACAEALDEHLKHEDLVVDLDMKPIPKPEDFVADFESSSSSSSSSSGSDDGEESTSEVEESDDGALDEESDTEAVSTTSSSSEEEEEEDGDSSEESQQTDDDDENDDDFGVEADEATSGGSMMLTEMVIEELD